MLPSPGFSIPSIGTPLHQLEEDQQILPNALQQQQPSSSQQSYPLQQLHTMSPNLQSGMFPMSTPQKTMHTYAPTPSFVTPQSMMTPQTPVSYPRIYWPLIVISFNKFLMNEQNYKNLSRIPDDFLSFRLKKSSVFVLNNI